MLELAEIYYEECRKRMANEKPIGTKEEDRWEMMNSKKKKQTQRRARHQDRANSSAAKEDRDNSVDIEMHDVNAVCVLLTESEELDIDTAGPEDHDNHCG